MVTTISYRIMLLVATVLTAAAVVAMAIAVTATPASASGKPCGQYEKPSHVKACKKHTGGGNGGCRTVCREE